MAAVAKNVHPPRNSAQARLLRGTLFTPHGAQTVWIRDISPSGALVTSEDRLPAGCDVILKRGSIFAAGRVTVRTTAARRSTSTAISTSATASAVQLGSALSSSSYLATAYQHHPPVVSSSLEFRLASGR